MDKEAKLSFMKGFAKKWRKSRNAIPKSFTKGVNVGNKAKVLQGYKMKAGESGPDSFVAYLPMMAAEKVLGKTKVRDAVWKNVGKPLLAADTAAGNVLKKIPGAKKLFTATEKVPWDSKGEFYRKVRRSSALAPLVKARNIATPVIVGVAFEKGIDKTLNYSKPKISYNDSTQVLHKKAASIMSTLHGRNKGHEKKAEALRLLYKQAEMGLIEFPSNHSELQEKLGQLVNEDLNVFEKSLELAGGHMKLGELGVSSELPTRNAEEKFQSDILGESEIY